MKILITGSKGFLGKHTLNYFAKQGHEVTGIDKESNIFDGLPDATFDVLFHFAAFVGGRKGIDNNLFEIAKNIELDRQVIQWAETHVRKMIYPSSCAAYPKKLQVDGGVRMREDMIGGEPFDMYGMSKLASETMLKFSQVSAHIIRPFTIYGPGQSLDYPLPAIIKRIKQGDCSVWGSGQQVRDYVHIEDALRVFDYLLTRQSPITLNIGSGKPLTFIKIAETINKIIHGKVVEVKTQKDQPEGAGYRYADTTLLDSLGLTPQIDFDAGIRTMI